MPPRRDGGRSGRRTYNAVLVVVLTVWAVVILVAVVREQYEWVQALFPAGPTAVLGLAAGFHRLRAERRGGDDDDG